MTLECHRKGLVCLAVWGTRLTMVSVEERESPEEESLAGQGEQGSFG